VNGANPVVVNAGDQLTLALSASPFAPIGSLAGVHYTIDFTPVPEPGGLVLLATGGAASLLLARRRPARRRADASAGARLDRA
jgi:hypothetical protein